MDVRRKFKVNLNNGTRSTDTEIIPISSTAHSQNGGLSICYANAITTVLRCAQSRMRIIPKSHKEMVNGIVQRWGQHGAYAMDVLRYECAQSRPPLKFREVNSTQIATVLYAKRPVLFEFWIDETQWQRFATFFQNYPDKAIGRKDIGDPDVMSKSKGHTVVICGLRNDYYLCKNSWGDSFGDKGYFRMQKEVISNIQLGVFWDVFFEGDTLSRPRRKHPNDFRHFQKQKRY